LGRYLSKQLHPSGYAAPQCGSFEPWDIPEKLPTSWYKHHITERGKNVPGEEKMDFDELRDFIQKGESDRIEFKKSTGQRTAGTKAVCAMLNGLGGFVLFGVNDKGEIVGQEISTKSLEVLSNELRKIEPPAFPQLETFPIQKDKSK